MSTLAAPVAKVRSRIAVNHDAIAVAALACLLVGLVAATWGTWGNLGKDTGYDIVAGSRVATGQWPYVDFVYYYGPVGPLVLGGLTWLFGNALLAATIFGLALATAVVAATYLLARVFAPPAAAFVAAAMTAPLAFAPTNFSYVFPHTEGAPLGILAILVLVLAIAGRANRGGVRWTALAGVAAAVVALSRPEFAPAAFIAAGVWLALGLRAGSTGRRDVLAFALPAVGIPALVYGAFAVAAGPSVLLWQNLYPRDQLAAGASEVLRAHAPLTIASFAGLGAKALLYAAGMLALLITAGIVARRRRAAAAVAAFAALACAAALVRPEALRHGLEFVYGWIPAGAAIAVVLLLLRYRRRGAAAWTPRRQVELAGALALAVLAAKEYGSFLVLAPRPQPAVYLVPLAAVFLVRIHLVGWKRPATIAGAAWLAFLVAALIGLTLKDTRTESVSVTGPGGTVTATASDAAAMQPALDWLVANSKPGEPVLLGPQLSMFYVLSERPGALRQLTLLPSALPHLADQRSAIAQLDRRGVRVALIDLRTFPEYGHTRFGGSFDRLLAGWLQRNFVLVKTFGGTDPAARQIEAWERRSS